MLQQIITHRVTRLLALVVVSVALTACDVDGEYVQDRYAFFSPSYRVLLNADPNAKYACFWGNDTLQNADVSSLNMYRTPYANADNYFVARNIATGEDELKLKTSLTLYGSSRHVFQLVKLPGRPIQLLDSLKASAADPADKEHVKVAFFYSSEQLPARLRLFLRAGERGKVVDTLYVDRNRISEYSIDLSLKDNAITPYLSYLYGQKDPAKPDDDKTNWKLFGSKKALNFDTSGSYKLQVLQIADDGATRFLFGFKWDEEQ